MSTSLTDALLNVRTAYRLLADYQQHLVELLAFVRKELGATTYHQNYRNAVPRGFDRLELSDDAGRRFLPFNDISVLWIKPAGQQQDPIHQHEAGDLLIDVWVRSDTGNGLDKEPEAPVDKSASELRFYFYACSDPDGEDRNWFYSVWRSSDYPRRGELAAHKSLPGYKIYADALNLEDLGDKASARKAVAAMRERASAKLGQPV
ncbi:hypothetical protein NNJEOMEG_01038 [Fundidesulfovibrio magnetotacticus]|uniref:Uncharacterized protein n=1 Tax=Fundidesulfovibrio magnetotacticus TaxID=2730080 RepID=A0A6V8LU87_9BACT|nr:hypothetical protein [Fundidesulfovibrio magnetotacticus]GFK93207.1 hypothetical protein NNJEOMEG_01038 [Fundidesulfovibrio magnetotacticus]